ncbi:hypothetical protein TA3x_002288 [Tundrisphaera sp. TA3]|uniref:hypothetical protein n=1 Tax=Tundrisphaera sp. TA3 TaxID=3435775 RepID=UPI003EBF2BB6
MPEIPASPTIAIRDAFPSGPMIDGIRAASSGGEPRDDMHDFGAWGTGRAGTADDFPGSQHGVSAEDLLKTNELLRQLVEETKRQRVASLPAAGPSVYPGR